MPRPCLGTRLLLRPEVGSALIRRWAGPDYGSRAQTLAPPLTLRTVVWVRDWYNSDSVCIRTRTEEVSKMDKKQPLLKLSEESLMREPEEVFDILEKIGEG